MAGKKQITFSVDPHIYEWLKKQAEKEYLNVSTWLNQLFNKMKAKEK